jgi:hypothetical protein
MFEKLFDLFKGLIGKREELLAAAEEAKDLGVVVRDLEALLTEIRRISEVLAPAVADLGGNNILSAANVSLVRDAATALIATARWGEGALAEVQEAWNAIQILIPSQYRVDAEVVAPTV